MENSYTKRNVGTVDFYQLISKFIYESKER